MCVICCTISSPMLGLPSQVLPVHCPIWSKRRESGTAGSAGDEASGHIKASRATSGVDSGAGELGRAVDWSSPVKSCVIGSIPSVALSFQCHRHAAKPSSYLNHLNLWFDFDPFRPSLIWCMFHLKFMWFTIPGPQKFPRHPACQEPLMPVARPPRQVVPASSARLGFGFVNIEGVNVEGRRASRKISYVSTCHRRLSWHGSIISGCLEGLSSSRHTSPWLW